MPKKEQLNKLRRLSKKDGRNLQERAIKLAEETGEVARAVMDVESPQERSYRPGDEESILEESVDVILVALSIAYTLDASDQHISDLLEKKMEKWERVVEKRK